MQYIKLELPPIQTNCYVVFSKVGGEAYIIDPASDAKIIETVVLENNLTPKGILLTHGHFDHIGASDDLRRQYNVPLYIHKEDAVMLENAEMNCSAAFMGVSMCLDVPDVMLKDGDVLRLDGEALEVIHTPGHSKGSVSFVCKNCIFSGDTVFKGSYGRFDLPGGNPDELKDSIKALLSRNKNLVICPGHGEETSVEKEAELYNFI